VTVDSDGSRARASTTTRSKRDARLGLHAWSEQQVQRYQAVAAFAAEHLNDDLDRRDATATFPAAEWSRCAELGIQGLPVPTEHGGRGADPVTIALELEALGYGCRDNGLLFSLGAQTWSCTLPILRSGSDAQKARYLPALCAGSLIGVQAMTEPDSGSDAFSLRTRAQRVDDGWVLDGTKTFITNAPVADVFVVFASTDEAKGFAGVSAFLVDRSTPGVSVGPPIVKMGLQTSPMAEIVFSGCHLSDDHMLGRPGSGFAIFNTSMDWERAFILAPAVGTMRRQLHACLEDPAVDRADATRIAEMKIRVETSRLLLHSIASRRTGGRANAFESSMLKLYLSECFLGLSLDALQMHADSQAERDVRDAMAARIYSGTSEIQRDLVARHLGL